MPLEQHISFTIRLVREIGFGSLGTFALVMAPLDWDKAVLASE